MIKVYTFVFTIVLFLALTFTSSYAQLSGTKTIDNLTPTGGNNYQSFTDAITALNSAGVGPGGVTFDVIAGQTFNENPPVLNATGTASNQIIFQRTGAGANPKIIPSVAGTIAPSTTIGSNGDGIMIINGGDYITFNAIDLQDNAAFTGNGRFEYGYYTKKASGTDACKNLTIRNCGITLNSTSGSTVIYSSAIFVSNITGTATTIVTSTGGRSENIKIYNNTVGQAYSTIQVRGFADVAPYAFYDQNIEIGVDGANTITSFGGGASQAHGIYVIYQNNIKIANNIITGGTGNTQVPYGIFTTTGVESNVDIYNNTITVTTAGTTLGVSAITNGMGTGGTTGNVVNIYNNTITGCTNPSGTSGDMSLLYNTANPSKLNIYGNNIVNNTQTGTGTIFALYTAGSVVDSFKVYNNTITNNIKSSSGIIHCIGGSPGTNSKSEIYNNLIHSNTAAGATINVFNIQSGLVVNIYKNKVYNITSSAAGGIIYGMLISGGTTVNIYNNLMGDLKTPAANATADVIRGINITSTTANSTINLSYNTIYLNAASSGTNFSTTGLFHTISATATTAALVSRNNIIVNTSTPKGTGLTVAYRRSTPTLTNYGDASNNNLYYAGTPASNRLIFYDASNSDQTLELYKIRVEPRDSASQTENIVPKFISTAGASPDFLHLNTNIGTLAESNGIMISGLNDDYDGVARYNNPGYPEKPGYMPDAPDIGADEFGGLQPVIFTYTLLTNTSNTVSRQFTANIINLYGIAGGSNKPRLYYKKSSQGSYAFDDNPSQTGNDYTFNINYTNIGGVTTGDIIQYYVAAQDINGYTETSPLGGSGSNPPGTTAPGTQNQYNIVAGYSGTFNVGTGQTYTNITAAITAASNSELSGPVIFNLTDPSYTAETFPITIGQIPGLSPTNTITIRPASGVNALVHNSAGTGVFVFNGTDYFRVIGSNSTDGIESLVLRNGGATATEPGILFQNGATQNIIDGCFIETDNTTSTEGAIQFGTTNNSTGNLSNTISNCEIKNITGAPNTYATGIYSSGTFAFPNGNNSLTNNKIYNFSINGVSIGSTGNGDAWTISGNNFYNNLSPTLTAAQTAINLAPGLTSNSNIVSGNFIGGSTVNCGGTPWTTLGNFAYTAITVNVGITGATKIYNNTIKNIDLQGIGASTFTGINGLTNGLVEIGVDGGNNIGGPTAGEQIKTVGNTTCIGISTSMLSAGGAVISNNVIQNMYSSGTGTAIGNRGISHSSGANITISNNVIRNNRSDAGTTTNVTSSILGIYTSAANLNQVIEGNTISGLEASSGTAATTSQGIVVTLATGRGTISRNRIYGLKNSSSSSAADIFGIHCALGEWNVFNNQITLDQNTINSRVAGIFDSSSTAARNVYYVYNSVLISGSSDIAAANNSYGFLRSNSASNIYLRNNLFYNQKTGGTGFHYGIGNVVAAPATGWGAQASEFNMFIPSDASRMGEWGAGVNYNFTQWKLNTNCDFISSSFTSAEIPAALFTDAVNGNLNINTSDANSWYLSGAASQLTNPSVNNDFNADPRSITIANGSTDIGSDEFTAAGNPPLTNIPVSIGTNNITIGGKPIGVINVVNNGGGSFTSINVQYYSGTNPPNPPATTLFGNGYLSVTANGGASGFTYDITFNYISEILGTIGNESDIRLAKSDNGGVNWTPYLTAGTGAGQYQLDMVNNIITVFGLNSFSIFAFTDAVNPLPVELASFTASSDRNNVKLNWITSTEINNSGFDIERKMIDVQGLNSWAKISNIQGHGNTNEQKQYSFNDNGLQTGKYAYRLKQIDYNGNFSYFDLSSEIEVGVPKEFTLSQNYPNPFNPVTKINYDIPVDSKVNLRVYDMLGREVANLVNNDLQKAGYYTVQLNGINMASGTYFFRMVAQGADKDFVMTKKMVLIK